MSEETKNTELATQNLNLATKGAAAQNGGYFEYKVVTVSDLMDGGAHTDKIEDLLNLYGEMGWRLSQTVVNEIGSTPFNNTAAGTVSSTQEETLLIFERWHQL